jgi:hypothetical protein
MGYLILLLIVLIPSFCIFIIKIIVPLKNLTFMIGKNGVKVLIFTKNENVKIAGKLNKGKYSNRV